MQRAGKAGVVTTTASGVGFMNAMLAGQSFLSLKQLWNDLAPLRRTASCGPALETG